MISHDEQYHQLVINGLIKLIKNLTKNIELTEPNEVAHVLSGLQTALEMHHRITHQEYDGKTASIPISLLKDSGWTQKQTWGTPRGWAWFPPDKK